MLSRIAYFCCLSLMLYASFIFYPRWEKQGGESVLGWDVSGYYWYLPSLFIYHDLKEQKFGDSIIAKYKFTPAFEQSYVHESGNRVITYSSGMALMYLPYFLIAHTIAKPLGYAADGFSLPYQLAIHLGSLLMAILGLWYLRKLLLLYFKDAVVAVTLLLLVAGTSYLSYSSINSAMTHNWLFTIYVFLLLNTCYFYRNPSYKYAIRIGLLIGLAILIRPSEMVAILIPLLWGMESLSTLALKGQWKFLAMHRGKILAAAICIAAIGLIQVIYWLYTTGQPFVYSYSGAGFSWLEPHWVKYMFSYRSGWITYTPLAILFFVGIIPFLFRGKNKVAVIAFFAINLYIVCAWNVWWYGGSGGRAMVQSYPVLLFPFATLLQFIFERKWLIYISTPFILLLAYFNIWVIYNAHAGQGLYDSLGMTKAFYWKVIYKYKVPWYYAKLKDTNHVFEGEPRNMQLLYENNFETDPNAANNPVHIIEGERSLFIDAHASGPQYRFAYKPGNAKWLRAQATFFCPYLEYNVWDMSQLIVAFEKDGKDVAFNILRVHRFLYHGMTKDIYLDIKIPHKDFDTICVYVWSGGCSQQLVIDNLKVWSFDE